MDKYISYTNAEKCIYNLEKNILSADIEAHYRMGYLMALDMVTKTLKEEYSTKGKIVKAKFGKWSKKTYITKDGTEGYQCSVCKGIFNRTQFCGGCGSVMENYKKGESDDSD